VIKRFFADGFLYFEFSVVLSLLYMMVGMPLVAPLFESARVGETTVNMVYSLICWLAVSGVMAWFEYKRGHGENRHGYFSLAKSAVQKLFSLLFMLLPLALTLVLQAAIHGRNMALTPNVTSGVLSALYRGYLWPMAALPTASQASWLYAIFAAIVVWLLTFGAIFLGFYMGRRRFETEFSDRFGREPNKNPSDI